MLSGPLRFLLVGDEPRDLRLLKALLREFDVYLTAKPAEAVKLARGHDVDVVLCDLHKDGNNGVDVLREIRETHPRAMRFLLSANPDLRTVIGAVNEGEVCRIVRKPWNNQQLHAWIVDTAAAAREVPPIAHERLAEERHNLARGQVGVLVIERDANVQRRLREILQAHYRANFASNTEHALRTMQQHETGVIVSETHAGRNNLVAVLKALKQQHPHIVLIAIIEHREVDTAIELVNEAQVYRLLTRPVRMGSCRLSVDSAIDRYWRLKQSPRGVRRLKPAESDENGPRSPARLPAAMQTRVRSLPGVTLDAARL